MTTWSAMTEHSLLIEIEADFGLSPVIFSANGEHLVSGHYNKVRVWRLEDSKEMATMATTGGVLCLAVSRDGRRIAAGTRLAEVCVWDAETYEQIFLQKEGYKDVNGVDFSPDSTRLVVASGDSTATVWDVATGKCMVGPLHHKNAVRAARYSPQGDRIATVTKNSVRVYDSSNDHLLVDIPVKVTPQYNSGLFWSKDQVIVISDSKIKLIDASTGSTVTEWPVLDTSDYSCITLSGCGEFIVYSAKRTVSFWDASTYTQLGLSQHTRDICSIAFLPGERFLAISGKDGKITIKNVRGILPSSSFTVPFIHISDTALNSWKQDRLTDAQVSLTETITSSIRPGHHALAGRALVRAHSQQWDTAIQDAEESIQIRPSVIGYIAKSIALIGGGRKKEGCQVFDFVFRHCDPIHVDRLLLIKAIIVFMAGEHDDAISRIDNLITTVPFDPTCYVVQACAYMYLLVGNSCMGNINYQGAIQSFERARTQMRHHESRQLLVISLISGWRFGDLSITIRQRLFESLYAAGRTKDAAESLLNMINTFDKEIYTNKRITDWVSEFKLRCYQNLERFGDIAVDAQQYDEAITHYSAAISLDPNSPQDIFIKRSKSRMAMDLWEDALNDANEAIARDPSSPRGYETKHAALHAAGHYVDAVDTFETMLSKIAQSPDPNIRGHHGRYISPSSTRVRIRKIVQRTIRRLPRVLINTTTGHLHNKAEQASAFESLPLFSELISSMTTFIDRGRIKREVRQYFRYVMLSHKWEDNEPLFQQVVRIAVYDLNQSPTHDKLQMFCKITRDAGFNWAWSDTCCINKQDNFVLQEALVAMFGWYRGSAMMIVFLRGVHSSSKFGGLMKSIWNTRAWTLQEYVAAKVIRFYTEDWTPYLDLGISNHKESPEIISEMEQATGVSAQQLIALRPGLNSIREKLCLASARKTTLVEDAAYSLLGIFSVTGLPAIYGEGESTLGRLLAHVLPGSGDVSVLAWAGQSSNYNSCLPSRITVYNQPATSHIPPHIEDAEMEKVVTTLRTSTANLDLVLRLYDHVNQLSAPWFAGSRMKLPCIAFKLPPLSSRRVDLNRVYRLETPTFGIVEFKTKQDLSRVNSLYLVHPWLDSLFDREDIQNGAFVEDEIAEPFSPNVDGQDIPDEEIDASLVQPSQLNVDDEDISDEEFDDNSSPLPEPESSLRSAPVGMVPMDRETRALRLVARLRQPFGALLFTLVSTPQIAAVYKRVAADSIITVQIQENVPLDELLDNVGILDVL